MANMYLDDERQEQENDDDLLALCDLVEEYKDEVGSLRDKLSHTQLELQKADENLSASEVLVAELEDSIYYLDDDLSSKTEVLQRVMCLLTAESPADDILAGMSLVITAYQTGRDLDEVPLMASDGHKKEMVTLRLHYEQLLSAREEDLACARDRERALTAANQQLRQERDRLGHLLRTAESSAYKNSAAPTAVGSDDDDDDDDDQDEEDRGRDCKVTIPRRRKPDQLVPPDVPSPYRRPNFSGEEAEDSPQRSRARGAVVLQAIRSARARSVAVVAAAKDAGQEEEAKDAYADEPHVARRQDAYGGGVEESWRRNNAAAASTPSPASDARTSKASPKASFPHLSFSHPKFKRDAQGDEFGGARASVQDEGDCAISPEDLRHGIRSYSVFGQREKSAQQTKPGAGSGPSSPLRKSREQQRRTVHPTAGSGFAGVRRSVDNDDSFSFRPSSSSSGTQGRTDGEDDDDDDDDNYR
jgi:hypothetical protein